MLDSLIDSRFTVNLLPCVLLWHVSWLSPMASDDEGDGDGWEAACVHCNSSLNLDPTTVNSVFTYMAGMCSCCFAKFYSHTRR
jgi:hypothetical protein